MNQKQVEMVRANLQSKDTTELLAIWNAHDREAYSNAAFEAIRLILEDRNEDVPPHAVTDATGAQEKANSNASVVQAAECPHCGSDQIKKRFFGGSKAGAVACFVLGGYIAVEELNRPGGDPLVLVLLALFVLVGIAALTGKRYKCLVCRKTFNPDFAVDLPVQGEMSRWAVYSLFVCWMPLVGLLVAIPAVIDTSKRRGIVRGRALAWISMGVSAIVHLLVLFAVIRTIFENK